MTLRINELSVPVEELRYCLIINAWHIVLTTGNVWKSWFEDQDILEFYRSVPTEQCMEFENIKDLVNFCVEHGLKIIESSDGHLY